MKGQGIKSAVIGRAKSLLAQVQALLDGDFDIPNIRGFLYRPQIQGSFYKDTEEMDPLPICRNLVIILPCLPGELREVPEGHARQGGGLVDCGSARRGDRLAKLSGWESQ